MNAQLLSSDAKNRLKLYQLKNGYTFASRKDVPVADGNTNPDAVMIVAHDSQGRLLVIQEERPITGGGELIWDIPAGMIDEGETPEQAAIREIKEETGLTLDKTELWKYNSFVSPGMVDESNAIVRGFVSGTISKLHLMNENIQAYLMDPDDMARAGLMNPNIKISTRLALLLL